MAQVAAGVREAEGRVLARLLPRLRAICRRALSDRADADEAVQTASIEVLRSAASYRGAAALERWADVITSRAIARVLRTRKRRALMASDVDPDDMPADGPEPLPGRETPRPIQDYLGTLSDDLRAVLLLRHVLDFSIDECAEALGASRNTIKDRLLRAREAMRRQIRRDMAIGASKGGRA